MDMLEKVKVMLGVEANKDALLTLLIEEAKEDALNYCNLDDYKDSLDSIVIKMVRFKYGKLGAEALSSQSFSGVSEAINVDYTPDIYKALNRFKRPARLL